jgi:hypothetical protein
MIANVTFRALVLFVLIATGRAAEPQSVRAILDRVGEYVRRFEAECEAVISDETYEQKDVVADEHDQRSGTSRRIQSEMLFTWIPEQQSWLTARIVTAVNSKPVADSKARIDAALSAPTAEERRAIVRRLRDEGARFNLGRVYRNFNDPTFVLQLLDPSYETGFAYSLQGEERVNGADAWRLAFAERTLPSVILTPAGDLPSSGVVWISRSDGAVVKTRLTVFDARANAHAEIVVDFRLNPRFGVWMPSQMKEHYWQLRVTSQGPPRVPFGPGIMNEQIEGTARYSNFRRFETSARIVTPRP